jgi:hypothetical protein
MMAATTCFYAPIKQEAIEASLNHVRVVPTGSREWTIVEEGRVLVTLPNRNDADHIAEGLRALRSLPGLYDRIAALEDALDDCKDLLRREADHGRQ